MRLRVANQHQKTHQRRIDFLHKTSFLLLRENQVETVAMEDLNVRGMMANKKLARHIADVSWGTFGSFLQYKAKWTGKNVIQCDRFSPSSKQCVCGYKNNELTLADRSWACQSCGAFHDRDILAAQNIKRFALTEIEKSNGAVRADV
jgi:putative transposase